MIQRRPAFRFLILFVIGILLAEWFSIPLLILFFLSTILILFHLIFRWKWRQQLGASVMLECSIIVLGFLLQTLQRSEFHYHKLEPQSIDEPVVVFGTIDSEPTMQSYKMSCVVQMDSLNRFDMIERLPRRVLLVIHLSKGEHFFRKIEFGEKVESAGVLEQFPFQRNPGEFDYGKYLALNDVQGVVSVKGVRQVRIVECTETKSLQAYTYSIQRALYRCIDNLHSPTHASFLKGIIFGYRAEIPVDIKQSFIDTGTIHILAVSGSNVAFVVLIFVSVLGLFRLSRKAISIITIFGLVAYMLITGSSASVVRATIMAIVLLCGTLFERKADIYNSICIAALILLLWNTNTLFDVGFQLSFAAVISIVYFYPKLETLIRKIPERFEEIKAIDGALKLFAVSLAAQLGTIPFTAYYFGRISFVSLLANIPVVPVSGLNTFIGTAEIIFSPISSWIAQLYATANDFLVWFLLGFVKRAASMPFAYLVTSHLPVAVVAGYYILVVGIFNMNNARVRAWTFIFILCISNYLIFDSLWSHVFPKLTVTAIDVGQGDAILLEFPEGRRMLVDTGPSSQKYDAGERIIVPFLRMKGITSLDYLLITHPHSDHLGGAGSILQYIKVDTLVITSLNSKNSQLRNVFEIARKRNVGFKPLTQGKQVQIGTFTRVYVLYPNPWQTEEKNFNNSSLVLRVLYGNSSILLVGDAESIVEQRMIARYGSFLSSNVLKVGHHGSKSGTSEEFVKVVHPSAAIISVGNHNKFGHPSTATLKRLSRNSIEMYRTDKSGAIILESDGISWTYNDWRQKL